MSGRWVNSSLTSGRRFIFSGSIAFAIAAVLLILFPSSLAGIEFHQMHYDSLLYLCHGLQMGPLGPDAANAVASAVAERSNQVVLECYLPDGNPILLLATYYPRIALPVLLAVASAMNSALPLLGVPVLVMAVLGGTWGYIVSLPGDRPTWLRWIVLFLPIVSFSWVLWLGSLMTEGIFTLALLVSVMVLWGLSTDRLSPKWAAFWLFVLGIVLLTIRTSWPIAGLLWGLGLQAVLPGERGVLKGTALKRLIRLSGSVLVIGLGVILALLASRLLEVLIVPDANFPPSNEPSGDLPTTLSDLLLVMQLSLESVWVGIGQSLQIPDPGSLAMAVLMPLLIVLVLAKAPLRVSAFVVANWVLAMAIVGVVSICCGGLDSYFRYLIPAMFATLAAAWLSSDLSRASDANRHRPAVEAGSELPS